MSTDRILDEFLVLKSQDGDRDALAMLIERWQRPFLRFATVVTRNPDLAADCVQDAWIKIIRNLPRLRDPVTWEAWSLRIVSNQCLDRLRSQRDFDPVPEVATDPIGNLEAADTVAWTLAQLSDEHRLVLALHYLQGMEVKTMASVLRIPAGTVKSRLFKARENFKRLTAEPADSPGEKQHERTGPTDSATARYGSREFAFSR